jgi:hypothetical protein
VAKLPLACALPTGRAEVIVPTGAESWQGLPISNVTGDMFMATVRNREEKGSDVNVATHLLFLPMSSAGRSRTPSSFPMTQILLYRCPSPGRSCRWGRSTRASSNLRAP